MASVFFDQRSVITKTETEGKKSSVGDKLLSRKNKTEVVEFLPLPYTKIHFIDRANITA